MKWTIFVGRCVMYEVKRSHMSATIICFYVG